LRLVEQEALILESSGIGEINDQYWLGKVFRNDDK
jgi:hypothetical protein